VKIALVIERFEPGGGVENVAWQVARGLADAGDDVTVLARRGRALPGITLRRLSAPSFWQPLRVVAFSRAAARASATGFDVVHTFSRTRHQDVYRAGGGSHAEYMEGQYGAWGARWRRLSPRHATLLGIESRVFADARQIVQCNSALVRGQLQRRHGVPDDRLVVIRNGVDLQRFRPASPAPGRSACDPRGPVWLLVGSGWRRKGLDVALRALAGAPGVLRVVGRDAPGPWRALAARLGVADRLELAGTTTEPERAYAEADALLLPTRYDAFANVCLEALACGLPVVTSGANGAAEILGDAGIVVPDPEDAPGFARALVALADPAERARRAAAARGIAERHSWEAHVTALRALYARVRR
jgi:UDP-glucose:(heptosyl)LPS alpha-1,3-glucosyltransferase